MARVDLATSSLNLLKVKLVFTSKVQKRLCDEKHTAGIESVVED